MNYRRGLERIVAVAIALGEIAIPFFILPPLFRCCWSGNPGGLWLILAVAYPSAIVFLWVAIEWIMDGFRNSN